MRNPENNSRLRQHSSNGLITSASLQTTPVVRYMSGANSSGQCNINANLHLPSKCKGDQCRQDLTLQVNSM